MRRLPVLKTKNKALLAGPFLVWTVAFIVIPLLMVILLRLHRRKTAALPLTNVERILAPATISNPCGWPCSSPWSAP